MKGQRSNLTFSTDSLGWISYMLFLYTKPLGRITKLHGLLPKICQNSKFFAIISPKMKISKIREDVHLPTHKIHRLTSTLRKSVQRLLRNGFGRTDGRTDARTTAVLRFPYRDKVPPGNNKTPCTSTSYFVTSWHRVNKQNACDACFYFFVCARD